MTNLVDPTTRTTKTTAAALAASSNTSGRNNRTSTSHLPSTPSRQRSRTPVSGAGHWRHHLPAPQPLEPANEWGCDFVSPNLTFSVDAAAAAPNPSAPLLFSDETFLNALAENEFSSPSTYPSFTGLSPPRPPPLRLPPSPSQSQSQSRSHPFFYLPQPNFQAPASSSSSFFSSSGLANAVATSGPRGSLPACLPPIHPSAYHENTPSASSRFYNHVFNATFDADSQNTSQHTTLSNDILHEDEFAVPATPDTIVSDTMPSARVRVTPSRTGNDGLPSVKRRRTSHGSHHRRRSPRLVSHAETTTSTTTTAPNIATNGALNESPLFCDTDDDLLGESPTTKTDATGGLDMADRELTTIDLTEATEVPEELKKPEVDKRVKLSAFQCVICMDDVTTLTVTHCGHLYCAQCLHSSLNVEATKGKCPMCRNKIDMKPREAYTAKTKGFWPLELKLMTATRKGKRKADAA